MLSRTLAHLENAVLWVACASLFIMGAIVATSVIGRGMFNAPVPDDLLMIGLLMICVIVLPLGYVERADGHIVVTVIADRLPVRFQSLLSAFGKMLFGVFMGTMGFMLARKVPSEFAENLYYDGHLEIPTWPMKLVFAFGVLVFLARLALNIWAELKAAFGPAREH